MKIFGYSERGAMNALFHGMALDEKKGEKSMTAFIKLAKVEGDFTDFELYNEFSLSEFGDPDFMIKAKNKEGKDVVFFIEAKASCCKTYNLKSQNDHHENYMNGGNRYENGHSSNLFFQLRLKHYFFEMLPFFGKPEELETEQNAFFTKEQNGFTKYGEYLNRFKYGRKGNRKIGKNEIVNKVVKELQKCKEAYYIAIIPKQDSKACLDALDTEKEYGFITYAITWEEICNSEFGDYIKDTIVFNQNKNNKGIIVNQILNNV